MLTLKQINEIKEHLERAQNPVFYYDNDADGLCSFLLFRRYLRRGKGIAARSYPDLNAKFAKKAEELKADYVFILDKPVVSKDFFEEIDKMGLPIVWIDHHDVPQNLEGFNIFVYNWAKNEGKEKSSEPVSYWVYKITNRKEDLWLALIGCIADHFMPDFAKDFEKEYAHYWGKVEGPFDALYKTDIGEIARAFNFGLKDSTSHIVQLQNFLISCKTPEEVFLEVSGNSAFRKRYNEIKKRYDALLERAKENLKGNLIYFEYGGDLSISSDVSNELSYVFPEKYICVAYKKGSVVNISLRGKNVKEILRRILGKFENASGGGHNDAVGARIKIGDLKRFREELEKEAK